MFQYVANPDVQVSTINPEIHFNENLVATFNLLEAMRKNDIEEFVFASSSSVYGEPEKYRRRGRSDKTSLCLWSKQGSVRKPYTRI